MNLALLPKTVLRPVWRIVASSALALSSVSMFVFPAHSVAAAQQAQTCQDIRTEDPSAADGEYTIYPNGQQMKIYCANMDTAPAEYVTLVNTNTDTNTEPTYNYSLLRSGGWWPYTGDVISRFAKIRIDPLTLVVNRDDTTFSTSTGSFNQNTTRPYGQADNCNWDYPATANIDLTGTGFAIDDAVTFEAQGWAQYGDATFSNNRQVVNMWGGGQCGGIYPMRNGQSELRLKPLFTNDDSATTDEDTPVTIDVLANDMGSGLTIDSVTNGMYGTAAINQDGTITYTPDPDANGSDSFTYIARNSLGDTSPGTVKITIDQVNDAPVNTVPKTQNIKVNTSLTLNGSVLNLAENRDTEQSSTPDFGGEAFRAADGNTNGYFWNGSVTHTADGDNHPWWQVDLGSSQAIGEIKLWNRTDCCSDRLSNFYVFVSESPFASDDPAVLAHQPGVWNSYHAGQAGEITSFVANAGIPVQGRYVRVQLDHPANLSLAEVQVYGSAPLQVGDVDANSNPVNVTLAATHSTITLGGTSGLSFSDGTGTDDASVTFTGTVADINAALNGITFTPTTDYHGPASIAITTDDQGATGSGGAKTTSATLDINVAQNSQTVDFTAPNSATYGDTAVTLSASANSGLPVSFSVVSGPASVDGNQLTFTGAGTVIVRATQEGNAEYAEAHADQTITVAKAALTITADNKDTVYGSTLPALTASYSGFVSGDTAASLQVPVDFTTTATSASSVGSYTITPNTAASPNYDITFVNGALTVKPAPLTITADNKIKRIGSENPALTASYSGFVNGEGPADLDTQVTLQTDAVTNSPVGDYAITPSGATSANYTITFVNGTLTVTEKRVPVITWTSPAAITYGTKLSATQLNATADEPGTFSYSPALDTLLNAGADQTLSVTFTPTDSANAAAVVSTVKLTVNQAPLTITAENKTRQVGKPNPDLTATYSGFVNQESAADLDTPVTLATSATIASPVGNYPITASDAADANYAITFVNGTLSVVDKLVPGIGWEDPAAITYGTALSATQLNAQTNVPGTFSYNPALGTVLNAGADQTLSVTFTPNDPDTYSSVTKSVKLTVNKAPLKITAENKVKQVGTANPELTASYMGFVNNDGPASLATAVTLTTSATTTSPVGSYDIVAGGATAENYDITFVNGTLTVTDKQVPAITWASPSAITYGTALSAAQLNATANVPGTFSYNLPVGTVLNAGADQTLSVTFTPQDSASYTSVTKTVKLTVNKAPLTVTADNKSRSVGQANPVLTVTYSGFVHGETAANLLTPARVSTTATASSPAGVYPITVSGASSANYAITFVNGTLTVTDATVSPTKFALYLPLTTH